MWPTLFKIPWFHLPIRGYGLMLMIGFVGGTWWAARRASRVKGDPDFVVNLGFVALVCSIIGARLFFVAHYWDEQFAHRGLWAIVDVTAGGLEYYGGFLGAVGAILVYLWVRKQSIRLYLDILAPSLMFGMGMARIGCFLNGCCWGGICPPDMLWGVRFPYASPAVHRQWENRQVTLPAELIYISQTGIRAYPIPRDLLTMSPEQREGPARAFERADEALRDAKAKRLDSETISKLERNRESALNRREEHNTATWAFHTQATKFTLLPSDLEQLARSPEHRSLSVHPVQLYASLDGLTLAVLLNAYFYRRRRHGVVFGLYLLLYPCMRVVEEMIRSDNPHDTFGLTISQFVSVMLFLCGVAWMIAIHRRPLRSPRAIPFDPSVYERKVKSKKKSKK